MESRECLILSSIFLFIAVLVTIRNHHLESENFNLISELKEIKEDLNDCKKDKYFIKQKHNQNLAKLNTSYAELQERHYSYLRLQENAKAYCYNLLTDTDLAKDVRQACKNKHIECSNY